MARAGVTYHDVANAAETIKNQHQEPTVDRVREHLGTGSKSTIAPLLKRWRSDNGGAAAISGLPNDLVEVVKSLHERVQQMADHRIEQARRGFEALNDKLRTELTNTNNTIAQLTTRQRDLENQIERLNQEKGEQRQSLEDVRVNLARAESQRDEAVARTAELKQSVAELKQENKDIRDHFEHYQQRTAEDRQQEREQFRTVSRGLKNQIQDLQHRLTQAESSVSRLLDTNAQLQRSADEFEQANVQLQSNVGELEQTNAQLYSRVDELEQTNATLNSNLNRKTGDNQNLKRDLEQTLIKSQKYQGKSEQLSDKIAVLTRQKTHLDKEVAVLSQALEATKNELNTSQGRVALLTDENKVILQEKAVIQGQFKQLQASL